MFYRGDTNNDLKIFFLHLEHLSSPDFWNKSSRVIGIRPCSIFFQISRYNFLVVDRREDRFLFLFSCIHFSCFFSVVFSPCLLFAPSFLAKKREEGCVISDEFMPLFIRTRRVFVCRNSTTHLPRAILQLVDVSGLHFFMPDYSCLFVFREEDRDFEIKARKPDKAGPQNTHVFLRILKWVNLLCMLLLARSWPTWCVTYEITSAKIASGYRSLS